MVVKLKEPAKPILGMIIPLVLNLRSNRRQFDVKAEARGTRPWMLTKARARLQPPQPELLKGNRLSRYRLRSFRRRRSLSAVKAKRLWGPGSAQHRLSPDVVPR